MMSSSENSPLQQLWYTWSDVGLSSIHAGFRIRAASPDLTEIYSERVKSMDRYMRYALPPDASLATITPETAPVGLAFVRTSYQNEYILIHKNYSGKDGVGRPGNFFVHVIALGEYSPHFAAEDAIWLWESRQWRTNDQELDRRSNSLDPLPISVLLTNDPHFAGQFAQVRNTLPFLIEAYLSRRERTPLYIAAPASQATLIAFLIAGLTYSLPKQLLADLTFSTYEPDVTKATTEIIGTSWIAPHGQEEVFSPQFYREKLAINCFTGESSLLQNHPQVTYNPLAAHFAAYATDCLVNNITDQLDDLCTLAQGNKELTVDLFLQLYNNEIANTDSIGMNEIERYLKDAHWRIDRLDKMSFRKKIIECAVANPQWSETQLHEILLALRTLAEKEAPIWPSANPSAVVQVQESFPEKRQGLQKRSQKSRAQNKKTQATLANGLTLLAKRAIPDIIDALKKAAVAKRPVRDAAVENQKVEQVIILIRLMRRCLTLQNAPDIWVELVEEIQKTATALSYVRDNWEIRILLLLCWSEVCKVGSPHDAIISPFVMVSWMQVEDFLKVDLHEHRQPWNVMMVARLANDVPTAHVVQRLGANCSPEVNNLVIQFLQEGQIVGITAFLILLAEKDYPVKSFPTNTHIVPLLRSLLDDGKFALANVLVTNLTIAGYPGNVSYQERVEELLAALISTANGDELLDLLVGRNYPRKKQLVDILFSHGRKATLEEYITRVYRTPKDQNEFFLQEGPPYLQVAPAHIQTFIALYKKLLFTPSQMERLFVLLDAVAHEEIILSILTIAPLDDNVQFKLLMRYGASYLQMPVLAPMMVEWFVQLTKKRIMRDVLVTILTPRLEVNIVETLLKAVALEPNDQIEFLERYGGAYISQYSQLPILMQYIRTYMSVLDTNLLAGEKAPSFFFTILLRIYKELLLDEGTHLQIRSWAIIDKYCAMPTAHSKTLNHLTIALFYTWPPDDAKFIDRLVSAFVACIRTERDLDHIIENMRDVSPLSKRISQLLYAIAARVAKNCEQSQDGRFFLQSLIPYMVFALMWDGQERTEHFIQVFLDILLYHINVTHFSEWKELDNLLREQRLSEDALKQWQAYLRNLEILDQLDTVTRDQTNAQFSLKFPWSGQRRLSHIRNLKPRQKDSQF